MNTLNASLFLTKQVLLHQSPSSLLNKTGRTKNLRTSADYGPVTWNSYRHLEIIALKRVNTWPENLRLTEVIVRDSQLKNTKARKIFIFGEKTRNQDVVTIIIRSTCILKGILFRGRKKNESSIPEMKSVNIFLCTHWVLLCKNWRLYLWMCSISSPRVSSLAVVGEMFNVSTARFVIVISRVQ